jgi:hypothetical protein
MKLLFSRPFFWLVLHTLLFLLVVQLTGTNRLPELNPDSVDYVEQSSVSLTEGLTRIRPVGYPLLLKGIHLFSPSFTALPTCQFAVHTLAIFVFYVGLRSMGGSGWLAMAVASSLFYSNTLLIDGPMLMADAPAASLAVMSIGALLLVVSHPASVIGWLALGLGVFLAYQFRPAYLFLVPLVPLLGALLLGLISPSSKYLRLRKRLALGLAAVCFLPLLAFCSFRWALVGHFGLVSFNGIALVGVAGPFLNDSLVPELPDDLQPLARRMLEKRRQLAEWKAPVDDGRREDAVAVAVNHLRAGLKEPIYHDHLGPRGVTLTLRELARKIDARAYALDQTVWIVAHPAAFELYGDDNVLINERLSALSWAIVKAKPVDYLIWTAKSFVYGVIMVLINSYALILLLSSVALLFVIQRLCHLIQHLRLGSTPTKTDRVARPDYALELNVLLLIALSYALASLALMVIVQTPIFRYTDAAGIFLPAVAMVGIFAVISRISA